jgi:ATP-dependent DNA helicase RecG
LIEELLDRIVPFVSRESAELQDMVRRERQYKYPLESIREAALNALAHRDWIKPADVEVVNYSDRLTVTSPGQLENSMTVKKMYAGQRSVRNDIIFEVLRNYGYVDARGMGVRRKIVPVIQEYSGKEAVYEITEDYVRLTIPAKGI